MGKEVASFSSDKGSGKVTVSENKESIIEGLGDLAAGFMSLGTVRTSSGDSYTVTDQHGHKTSYSTREEAIEAASKRSK